MIRMILAAMMLCLMWGTSPARAHDFWLNLNAPDGQFVQVDIGYGHDFPNPETISEKRLKLFESPRLLTPQGAVSLKQTGENYAYMGKFDVVPGSYMAVGTYRPTFWSKGPDGWAMKNRSEMADAQYCEHVSMYAKSVLNVGGESENNFVGKPVGLRMEIVPLVNPATVKPGDKFPVQVLVDGKPARTVEIKATFAGFADDESKAFAGRTDLKGIVNIIPLKAGYWFAEAEYKEPYKDSKVCDETYLLTTLTFHIHE